MADPTITNVDLGSVEWSDGTFEPGTYTAVGATDLAEGTILAVDSVSLKYVDFVKGGSTNENGIPKAVVTYDVPISGAGDFPIKPLIAGRVRKPRLVIVADGDATNVDKAVEDELRDFSIVVHAVDDLSILDNQ
jgi:hypothetical protein